MLLPEFSRCHLWRRNYSIVPGTLGRVWTPMMFLLWGGLLSVKGSRRGLSKRGTQTLYRPNPRFVDFTLGKRIVSQDSSSEGVKVHKLSRSSRSLHTWFVREPCLVTWHARSWMKKSKERVIRECTWDTRSVKHEGIRDLYGTWKDRSTELRTSSKVDVTWKRETVLSF